MAKKGKKGCDADLADQYRKLYLELDNKWDELEEINFNRIGDEWSSENEYSREKIDLYIAQKRYAYCATYYKMFCALFNKVLDKNDGRVNLHVVSVGTGSKTDALALKYAVEDYKQSNIEKVKFICIDIKAWKDNDFFIWLNNDDEYYELSSNSDDDKNVAEQFINQEIDIFNEKVRGSIGEFEKWKDTTKNMYVVVFPNMLSEIKPADRVKDLIEVIKEVYNGKELYIVASKNPTYIDKDQLRIINNDFQLIAGRVTDKNKEQNEWINNTVELIDEHRSEESQGTTCIFNADSCEQYNNKSCIINQNKFKDMFSFSGKDYSFYDKIRKEMDKRNKEQMNIYYPIKSEEHVQYLVFSMQNA